MFRFAFLALCGAALGCQKSPEAVPRVVVPPSLPVWSPSPEVEPKLTQKVTIGQFQLMLPAGFVLAKNPPPVSKVEVAFWKKETQPGEPLALLSVTIVSDAHAAAEARLIFRQYLINFSHESSRAMNIGVSDRSDPEAGKIRGLDFTRFSWTGTFNEKTPVRGLLYGTVQDDQIITINGMNFGPTADVEITAMESIIATFRRN